jgi:hypothetical protein
MEERLSHVPETAGHGISLTRFDRRLFPSLACADPWPPSFLGLDKRTEAEECGTTVSICPERKRKLVTFVLVLCHGSIPFVSCQVPA